MGWNANSRPFLPKGETKAKTICWPCYGGGLSSVSVPLQLLCKFIATYMQFYE
jgi:hypothetical protein